MGRVDWGAMLTGLEAERTAAAQEVADIDAVIATVRQRANGASTPAKRPAKVVAAPAKNGRGKGGRRSPEALDAVKAQAKKLYEKNEPVGAIQKACRISGSMLYRWVNQGGWERPKPGAAVEPADGGALVVEPASVTQAEPTPVTLATERAQSTELPGAVRCTSCDLWTKSDPCSNCGTKLRRAWL